MTSPSEATPVLCFAPTPRLPSGFPTGTIEDMHDFDLVIVGGGLAGASLAVALRDSRLRIALVENLPPHPADGWDVRIYAISPANREFLEKIGAWKHLDAQRLTPIRAMQIFGDGGGRLDFSAYESGLAELGWILESSLLACELWESLKRQGNLSLFSPAQPQTLRFSPDSAQLTLDNGAQLNARLIVGADGRDSWVRQTAGIAALTTDYGERGVVANFACEHPHRNIARQWFGDDGVLAWLPLPGNLVSMVWSTSDAEADHLCALSAEALAETVSAAGDDALGKLQLLTPAAAFPLKLLRVPNLVAPRLVLLGDAAHGIHPLSGHGINLGFADARELSDQLAGRRPWQDIGDLRFLQRYQRARKEEIFLLQNGTDALHRLFRSSAPGLKPLRNLGLRLTNALPIVKTALVRYACGSL